MSILAIDAGTTGVTALLVSTDLRIVARGYSEFPQHFPADGWVEHAWERIRKMMPVADRHRLSLIQFAAIWNLSQPAVASVVPTFIQEAGADAQPIEGKIRAFAQLPDLRLSAGEVEEVRLAGDNTGCMALKGASRRHTTSEGPDEWPLRPELLDIARRYGLGEDW